MNSNEAYLKKGKGITDFLTWKVLFPIILIIYLIFSPISASILSVIISLLICIPQFKTKIRWKRLLVIFLLLHFSLTSIYSISPYLQLKDFKLFHWNWKETNGTIENQYVKWEEITRRKGPKAIANIQYSFLYNNQIKKVTKFEAIKIVYPWYFRKTEEKKEKLKNELSQNIENYKKNKAYKIFVNPKNGESKLFITTEKILVSNSSSYSLLMSCVQVFVGIALILAVLWLGFNTIPKLFKKSHQ
ncbi:hypothetical protein ACFOWU_16790 [Epilithonimonas zeae]|uniref:Uncharacterized protein n=1 Tax=Epilithonimonas zeae TaxID=1416779 RepID=A0A1N6JTH7_9FLAO|nr:hypothetical protein [Epilithonimonas zeae]SIO47531.1 hypothetical protein SAMN05444409_3796 [Epilithonimonas zeae]